MNKLNHELKVLFINEIKKLQESGGSGNIIWNSQLQEPDWGNKLLNLKYLFDIEQYARKIYKEVWQKTNKSFPEKITVDILKYGKALKSDLENWENELDSLNNQYDTQKNLTKNYELGLKKVIGNDLTNWESKITKAGTNGKDKEITDLKNKINDLEKNVKDKQDQILNHRCANPNNEELNNLKEELSKVIAERDKLIKKLGDQPTIPNDNKDKEKPSEDHDDPISQDQQLKEKIKEKDSEIADLKRQLEKQQGKEKNNFNSTIFLLIIGGIIVLAGIGGVGFLAYKKQKKKKKQIINWEFWREQQHFLII